MNSTSSLPLQEEILLLALDDNKGTTPVASMFAYAMGGAILSELILNKALAVRMDKDHKITVLDLAPTGDPVLDECLTLVRDQRNLKKPTARQLVIKGILTEGEDKVLGLFKRKVYLEKDGGPEAELWGRPPKKWWNPS